MSGYLKDKTKKLYSYQFKYKLLNIGATPKFARLKTVLVSVQSLICV